MAFRFGSAAMKSSIIACTRVLLLLIFRSVNTRVAPITFDTVNSPVDFCMGYLGCLGNAVGNDCHLLANEGVPDTIIHILRCWPQLANSISKEISGRGDAIHDRS